IFSLLATFRSSLTDSAAHKDRLNTDKVRPKINCCFIMLLQITPGPTGPLFVNNSAVGYTIAAIVLITALRLGCILKPVAPVQSPAATAAFVVANRHKPDQRPA